MQNLDLFDFILQLHFTRVELLLLLVLLPIIWLLSKHASRHNLWSAWIKEPMLSLLVSSNKKRNYKPLLLSVFFCIGIIAMSGPSLQKKSSEIQKSATLYFIVLDLSLSMLAKDEVPNRLSLARFKLIDILKQNPDSLASLIAYSGSAHVVIPLTEDHQTIISQLPALNPEIMPAFGSNPQLAMDLITQSMSNLNLSGGMVLWFTDEASNAQIRQAKQVSQKSNLDLKLILLGTEAGETVPLQDGRQLSDSFGQIVVAKAPISLMQASANANQISSYLARHLNPKSIAHLSVSKLLNQHTIKRQNMLRDRWHELGYWLIPLLMFLLIPLLTRHAILGLVILCLSNQPGTASAAWIDWWKNPNQQGQDLFDKKQYQAAINTFIDPQWRVASQYKAKHYEVAAKNYQNFAEYYNAGNAYAHAGKIAQAIANYKKAIKQNPAHEDAKHNLKLMQTLLQQQKQQGEQQQKQQGEQQQKQQGEQQQKQQQQNQQQDGAPSQENDKNQSDKQKEAANQNDQQKQQNQQATNQDLSNDNRYLQENDLQAPANNPEEQESEIAEENTTQNDAENPDDQEPEKQAQPIQLTKEQIAEIERASQYRQWLRTLPDNPSLLLQRKFKHEYNQRQKNRPSIPEKIW